MAAGSFLWPRETGLSGLSRFLSVSLGAATLVNVGLRRLTPSLLERAVLEGLTLTRFATSGTLKPEVTAAWRISGEGEAPSKPAKYCVK